MVIEGVDRRFIRTLFVCRNGKFKPKGQFIWCFYGKKGKSYVAVDNATGDAWVEEFKFHFMAKRWLHGKAAVNLYGERIKS